MSIVYLNDVEGEDRNYDCDHISIHYAPHTVDVLFNSKFAPSAFVADFDDYPDYATVVHDFGSSLSSHLLCLINFNQDYVWQPTSYRDRSIYCTERIRNRPQEHDIDSEDDADFFDRPMNAPIDYSISLRPDQCPYFLSPTYYPNHLTVSPSSLHGHFYQFACHLNSHPTGFGPMHMPPQTALHFAELEIHFQLLPGYSFKTYEVTALHFTITTSLTNHNDSFESCFCHRQ